MKWQLTSIIICLSFSKALAVRCYECSSDCETNPNKTINCPDGCYSVNSVFFINGMMHSFNARGCQDPSMICGGESFNYGSMKGTTSVKCCPSDLCNSGTLPDVDLRPNGKQCHFCVGDNCLGTLHCEGIEDHCFTYKDIRHGKEQTFKGCASKSFCDSFPSSLRSIGMNVTKSDVSVKCCKGNLCNSAESVTLSFLLMLFFLLFSFLLH